MGELSRFYYFTVQFNHIYIFGFSVELAMQDFLIHSGSLQKMLTALFDLVWNTQKVNGQFILENREKHPSKCWLDRESIQLFGADLC